ncbi:MAG: phosphotransferase family protein [Actinomycetota bacterium]|nr:phosphotransferase family protein [Actinomycetota bacterium]
MPIPAQRDAEQSRVRLAAWLAPKLGADGPVTVSPLRGPGATGFSNETLIADATWSAGGTSASASFVVRVAPTGYSLFPDPAFDVQYKVLVALGAHSPVPVPTVRWFEKDASVLGAPFFVMDEVPGRVPPDNPPYHVAGWLHDVPAGHREKVWWGAVDTIAELHALDWRELGLGFLERPELGPPGLAQQLAYYTRWLEALEADEAVPVARRALAWLTANTPAEEELVLCWGDARIGNIIYDEVGTRRAVLDWEMVTLGAREQDLAWALFLDRHHSEGCDVPRLAGFPSAAETVTRYERLSGRSVPNMAFYEVFAGFRFCVIMARLAIIFKEWGLLQPDDAMAADNTVSRLTARVLDERGA